VSNRGSFPVVVLMILLAVAALGCSANKPTTAQTQTAVIRLASLAGCDQITRSHPEKIPVVLADLQAAQASLMAGNVSSVVRALLVRNVSDPRDMAYLGEGLRLLDLQIGADVVPKPGTTAYQGFLDAFDGCRAGLQINTPPIAP
jgi:hypothetical protein